MDVGGVIRLPERVSILVFLDQALKEFITRMANPGNKVSILVFLDQALKEVRMFYRIAGAYVSILVFLDQALKDVQHQKRQQIQ